MPAWTASVLHPQALLKARNLGNIISSKMIESSALLLFLDSILTRITQREIIEDPPHFYALLNPPLPRLNTGVISEGGG